MSVVNIGKLEIEDAIVNAVGPGLFYCNLSSLTHQEQSYIPGSANVKITDLVYNVSGGIPVLQRVNDVETVDVYVMDKNSEDIRFQSDRGYVLDSHGDSNIVINFNGAVGHIFVGMSKAQGFTQPE